MQSTYSDRNSIILLNIFTTISVSPDKALKLIIKADLCIIAFLIFYQIQSTIYYLLLKNTNQIGVNIYVFFQVLHFIPLFKCTIIYKSSDNQIMNDKLDAYIKNYMRWRSLLLILNTIKFLFKSSGQLDSSINAASHFEELKCLFWIFLYSAIIVLINWLQLQGSKLDNIEEKIRKDIQDSAVVNESWEDSLPRISSKTEDKLTVEPNRAIVRGFDDNILSEQNFMEDDLDAYDAGELKCNEGEYISKYVKDYMNEFIQKSVVQFENEEKDQ